MQRRVANAHTKQGRPSHFDPPQCGPALWLGLFVGPNVVDYNPVAEVPEQADPFRYDGHINNIYIYIHRAQQVKGY